MKDLLKSMEAMKDPIRLKLLRILRDRELCVCEIVETVNIKQSRLSQHLRVLKDRDLVTERKDGKWVYYQTNLTRLEKTIKMLDAFLLHDEKKEWIAEEIIKISKIFKNKEISCKRLN
ncbi:MAG: ArsR/SmtB family transcription factor [Bacillota bacterium]